MKQSRIARPQIATIAPDAQKGLYAAARYLHSETTLEPRLLHLIDVRASQINGCAFCINLHTLQARADGEREERLHGLIAWRETNWYTEREEAALMWTESITSIAHEHITDELYRTVSAHFTEREMVDLTLAVATINSWNRFAIAFGSPPELASKLLESLAATPA